MFNESNCITVVSVVLIGFSDLIFFPPVGDILTFTPNSGWFCSYYTDLM